MGALSLWLVLALGGGTSDGLAPELASELARVRAVLARPEKSPRVSEPELVRRLAALGNSSAPALFVLVSGQGLEDFYGESRPEEWLCLPDRVSEISLAALAQLPAAVVLENLRAIEA